MTVAIMCYIVTTIITKQDFEGGHDTFVNTIETEQYFQLGSFDTP